MNAENEQKLIEAIVELNKTMKKIQVDVYRIYVFVVVAIILALVAF